jgi:hypothetical protein
MLFFQEVTDEKEVCIASVRGNAASYSTFADWPHDAGVGRFTRNQEPRSNFTSLRKRGEGESTHPE